MGNLGNKQPIIRYLSKLALPMMAHDQMLPPSSSLKLVIVIPSLAELDHINHTLNSLVQGSSRLNEAEVLVVVNQSSLASVETSDNNLKTIKLLKKCDCHGLGVHIIDRASPGVTLDPVKAGVGLARRIGMDSALDRLNRAGQPNRSAIACLDGDTTVAPGYIDKLLSLFDHDKQPVAGICHFEHPQPDDPRLKKAIIFYELWLRYLEYGLKLSGSPFAYHSIGSTMVVSAMGYALADGMPCRLAAEDFHFLQKVAKISRRKGIIKIHQTTVYPAARYSDRVLFGTGKAMNDSKENNSYTSRQVVDPTLFLELKAFFKSFKTGAKDLELIKQSCSSKLRQFMVQEKGWPVFERLQKNARDPSHFQLACHHWFDGLKIIRFLNLNGKDQKQDSLKALPRLLSHLEPSRNWEINPAETNDDDATAYAWLNLLREHWLNT